MSEHSEEWRSGFAAGLAAAAVWLREERDAIAEMERVQHRLLDGSYVGIYDQAALHIESLTPDALTYQPVCRLIGDAATDNSEALQAVLVNLQPTPGTLMFMPDGTVLSMMKSPMRNRPESGRGIGEG